MAEPSPTPLSDEELHRYVLSRLADPEMRARIEEIRRIMASGEPLEDGITAEDLPAFLRENRRPP